MTTLVSRDVHNINVLHTEVDCVDCLVCIKLEKRVAGFNACYRGCLLLGLTAFQVEVPGIGVTSSGCRRLMSLRMVCDCGHAGVASVDSDKLFKSKHSGVTSAVLLGEGAVETAGVTKHVSSVPVCGTFSWLCHSVRSLDIVHHSGVCTEHMLGKPSSTMHACMSGLRAKVPL